MDLFIWKQDVSCISHAYYSTLYFICQAKTQQFLKFFLFFFRAYFFVTQYLRNLPNPAGIYLILLLLSLIQLIFSFSFIYRIVRFSVVFSLNRIWCMLAISILTFFLRQVLMYSSIILLQVDSLLVFRFYLLLIAKFIGN